ncbi:MAG: class I SAM-dependent methyltransferase [Saprospiraceae bacterium]|nr:class I SAM-dependent methyltransferase [Saprospiraceae bacterium]
MKKGPHINTGIRKLLEIPQMYNLKRMIFGGEKYRQWYVDSFQIKEGDRILDIGCGTAHILKYLPENIEYHGIDMESDYINYCRSHYGHRAKFYNEMVGEVYRDEWKGYFDIINMHGLIHHLNDDDSGHLIELVFDFLKAGGSAFTADSLFHENQSYLSRWFVSKDRGQNIRTPSGYLQLVEGYFDTVSSQIIKNHTRIPYSLFYMKLSKN